VQLLSQIRLVSCRWLTG